MAAESRGGVSEQIDSSAYTKLAKEGEERALAPQPDPRSCLAEQSSRKQEANFPNFKGSLAFTSLKPGSRSRSQLPFLRPENERLPMLSLLSKLFGQDITKISLPVILAEPHTAIMKGTEVMAKNEATLAKAAMTKDSIERLILVTSHFLGQFATYSSRLPKKPFNPMLGETYELVTEDFRFFGE